MNTSVLNSNSFTTSFFSHPLSLLPHSFFSHQEYSKRVQMCAKCTTWWLCFFLRSISTRQMLYCIFTCNFLFHRVSLQISTDCLFHSCVLFRWWLDAKLLLFSYTTLFLLFSLLLAVVLSLKSLYANSITLITQLIHRQYILYTSFPSVFTYYPNGLIYFFRDSNNLPSFRQVDKVFKGSNSVYSFFTLS